MNQKFKPTDIKLIIGLGNPGKQYENTYHNVGFLFIDYINKNYSLLTTHYSLLKTKGFFMNESGFYVVKCMKKYNTNPHQILIVHDDTDLPLDTYKLQFGRGAAGHKGIESIIRQLGTKEFWRLRIGIRSINDKKGKAEQFVLRHISKTHTQIFQNTFKKIITEIFPDAQKN